MFFLANPEASVRKESIDRAKAPSGTFEEPVNFAGQHNAALSRLGVDMVAVNDDGSAVVHALPPAYERLEQLALQLEELGRREQAKWVTIRGFEPIPSSYRLDTDWYADLDSAGVSDALVELQPLLTRTESDQVARAIAELFDERAGEGFRASGTDFSGRMWLRGVLTKATIRTISRQFFSVQSLHQPISAVAASPARRTARPTRGRAPIASEVSVESLPSVGIVDTGVPVDHLVLAGFRRGGYIHPDSFDPGMTVDDHASRVASRAVFGAIRREDLHAPEPQCRYVDIHVAEAAGRINDKLVVDAIGNVVANFPDVRVFNLSFDNPPLVGANGVAAQEQRLLSQDLDNFVFARDVVVVVAAGNSTPGVVPNPPYPKNHLDRGWRVGNWASTFNTVTCGSFSEGFFAGGLANHPGAPSPFCRTGPGGIAEAPLPDVSSEGGDTDNSFAQLPGAGVETCNAAGVWEDMPGTSFSAPVVANACARALAELQQYCPRGSRPFGCLVRAFLAVMGVRDPLPSSFADLADQTLGFGRVGVERIASPAADSAILFWQGVIAHGKDMVQIQVPVPAGWITDSEDPVLEVAAAWDTPTNAAVRDIYGCRDLILRLRPAPEARAARSSRARRRAGYPLVKRTYRLKRALERIEDPGDIWVVEVSYEQIADYTPTIDFSPEQRVGLCMRLVDQAGAASPQEAIQSLDIAKTMVHLSTRPTPVRAPVLVRSRAR